ncbi:MAG: bifunctional phosphopantothenoylcysteine decarboxylase/phosphopantothenate--cysteine ligase CoaBC [Deltaproteobacteria bacterium]|nr:bifunctional phosphopantothenoylcysteine decarboxylase/phosphopantothenate--cysteine ligase CoaBC [Deltaproteobacteria bacterium]
MKTQTILITAGPTIEPIDPMRHITNHSSGKMGYALARACIRAGYRVILISGPTQLKKPGGCLFVPVKTARDMLKEVLCHFPHADICFKVAAVADYRVSKFSSRKIKKTRDRFNLTLIKNPDILKKLGQIKKNSQTLVGFAAETHQGVTYARQKLKEKNLDWIVLNEISKKNVGFGSDLNEVTLISSDGKKIKFQRQKKEELAKQILKTVTKVPVDQTRRFSFTRFNLFSFLGRL